MLDLKFRIGTKLAISAGIGVLLVIGMVANEWISSANTAQLSEVAAGAQETNRIALAVDAASNAAAVGLREIRLARSAAEIDQALAMLRAQAATAQSQLDAGIRATGITANRERMAKIKAQMDKYVAAGADLAAVRKSVLDISEKQNQTKDEWIRVHDILGESSVMVPLANRSEFESDIQDTTEWYTEARLSFWQLLGADDTAIAERASRGADNAANSLNHARSLTNDKGVAQSIDRALASVRAYKNELEDATKTVPQEEQIQATRATPARAEIRNLVEETIKASAQRADETKVEAEAARVRTTRIALGIGALVVVILIGSAVFAALSITKPIRRIGEVLLALANGDKTVDVPYAQRVDEVGDAARAARTFKENLLRIEKMEGEQKEIEARGAAERKADMHKLADSFEAAVGEIVNAVSLASTDLEAAATTMTHTAENTQKLSTTVAGASEEASANVQSVASASDELTSSVEEIGRQVHQSSKIANEAVRQASATTERMNALTQAADRIGNAVKIISAIAEQTNLLALNATIEAARAGDAGKGFAVVASEVKALATQTAKATDEIAQQIAGIQAATGESVTAIEEINTTIYRISEIATSIASSIEEQGAATAEIARNVQQAARGTNEVASNIIEVSKGAGETGSASGQVLSSAQALAAEGTKLKVEVQKFLATVRAA